MYKNVMDLLRNEELACERCLRNYRTMTSGTRFIKPAEVEAYLANIRQAIADLEEIEAQRQMAKEAGDE